MQYSTGRCGTGDDGKAKPMIQVDTSTAPAVLVSYNTQISDGGGRHPTRLCQ